MKNLSGTPWHGKLHRSASQVSAGLSKQIQSVLGRGKLLTDVILSKSAALVLLV